MTWAVLEKCIFIVICLAAKIVQQEVGFVIYPRNRQVIVELASVCVDRLRWHPHRKAMVGEKLLDLGRSSSRKLSIAVLLVTMSDDPFSGMIRRTSLLFRCVFRIFAAERME